MPFIHIKSLPLKDLPDISVILKYIAKDFSIATEIQLNYIHVTWEYFTPYHHVKGDKTNAIQPESEFPTIVDLLTPDFNSKDTIGLLFCA